MFVPFSVWPQSLLLLHTTRNKYTCKIYCQSLNPQVFWMSWNKGKAGAQKNDVKLQVNMEKEWYNQTINENSAKGRGNSISMCCDSLNPISCSTYKETTVASDAFQQVLLACTEKTIFLPSILTTVQCLDNWNV